MLRTECSAPLGMKTSSPGPTVPVSPTTAKPAGALGHGPAGYLEINEIDWSSSMARTRGHSLRALLPAGVVSTAKLPSVSI